MIGDRLSNEARRAIMLLVATEAFKFASLGSQAHGAVRPVAKVMPIDLKWHRRRPSKAKFRWHDRIRRC